MEEPMLNDDTKPEFEGMSDSQREMADRLVKEYNSEAMFLSYPQAFAGILHRSGVLPSVAIYDASKCIDLIINEGSIDSFEAEDIFSSCVLRGMQGQGLNSESIIYFAADDMDLYEDVEEINQFDAALLGLVEQAGSSGLVAAYEKQKCISIVMEREGIASDTAETFLAKLVFSSADNLSPTFIEIVPGYSYPTFDNDQDETVG